MKASTINEIKQELIYLPSNTLAELCLRLAKFKKENKELLTYLLFEAQDEQGYINSVKNEIDESFESMNTTNIYFSKKSLRKILRNTNKYIRYTGSKEVEANLLLYYCNKLKHSGIAFEKYIVLNNLYQSQLKKIKKVIDTMHEDLQYEYLKELNNLID